MLVRTLHRFDQCPVIDEVVVVASEPSLAECAGLIAAHGITKVKAVVAGGDERQYSVARGLAALSPAPELVVVHDAVRPFVSVDEVSRVVAAAAATGAAILGCVAFDTVKEVASGRVLRTLERSGILLAQTPQAFRYDLLVEAHEQARRRGTTGTDDAVLVEQLGHAIAVVEGGRWNLKITTAEDLRLAEFLADLG